MTVWTDFVKKWADDHNTKYGCALSMPKCREDYRKMHPVKEKMSKAMSLDPKPKRKSKSEFLAEVQEGVKGRRKSRLSNSKKLKEMVIERKFAVPEESAVPAMEMSPIRSRPMPVKRPKGKGIAIMSSAEDANGLTHIYPLSHGQIIRITRGI